MKVLLRNSRKRYGEHAATSMLNEHSSIHKSTNSEPNGRVAMLRPFERLTPESRESAYFDRH